jgi:hypothetical protein
MHIISNTVSDSRDAASVGLCKRASLIEELSMMKMLPYIMWCVDVPVVP